VKVAWHKLAREGVKTYFHYSRAWLLSLGISRSASFKLSAAERRASDQMSVLVAVHDGPQVTERCLKSLETFGGDAEIIVVDDASKLAVTRQILDTFCARNRWKLIRHDKAQGHSRSSEAGASVATRPYLCLLNSDTVVTQHSWAAMAKTFELSPKIATVGPSTSHTPGPQFVSRAKFCRHHWNDAQVWNFAEKYVAKHGHEPIVELNSLGGFAFFVRKSVWDRLGGFDKNLPDYGNETELCWRIREAGFKNVWSKGAYIHHLGSQSYGTTLGFRAISERCVEAESYIQKKRGEKVPVGQA